MNFDDFISGYKLTQLDEVRRVQTVGTDFSELLRKYEEKLNDPSLHHEDLTEVLTPSEINSFLQTTQQFGDHKYYFWKTGKILSTLLQSSYNQGYNHFNLETNNLSKISGIGHLIGKEENHLVLSVQGDVGNVGRRIQYSIFTINGVVEGGFGAHALNSTFIFNGPNRGDLGFGAEDCTFKTPIWDNIQKMKEIIQINRGNTLIYIDNGKEVKIDLG